MKIPLITFAPAFLSLFIASQANGQVPADWNPLDFPGESPIGPTPPPGGPPLIPPLLAPTGNEYTIINLGGGFAYGINDYGQVVGSTGSQAILYSGTGTGNTILGGFGGSFSAAYDINNHGHIVGTARNTSGTDRATFFVGLTSGLTDVGAGQISSVNDHGQIVGTSNNRATLFSLNGSPNTDLGTLGGGNSYAAAINDNGTIVGGASLADNSTYRATLFSGTGSGNIDLGTLGGNSSGATHLNVMGTIIGESAAPGSLYTSTLFSGNGTGNSNLGNLGYFESVARGINSRGQIVGSVSGGAIFNSGFIRLEGTLSELTTLAATSAAAQGITRIAILGNGTINEFGQIAAVGNPDSLNPRALLINPTTPISVIGQNPGAEYLPVGGTRLVAGMAYSKVTSLTTLSTDPGEGVQASLFGGTAGNGQTGGNFGLNRNVTLSFTTGDAASYGNIISLTGTENDTLTIELTYEEAELIALFGSENAALGWLNGTGVWVNAVDGNTGGTATFVDGAWSSAYPLGTYGINRDTNSVWAIINHNSSFAVIQGVPEPSALLLSALGSLALFRRRVRS